MEALYYSTVLWCLRGVVKLAVLALVVFTLAGCEGPAQSGSDLQRASAVAAACAEQGGKARIVSSYSRRTFLSVDCFLGGTPK